MSLINIPYTFTPGNTIIASQHNVNFQTIYNDYNGNIQDANIASNAAISYTKLALNNTIKSTDILSTTIFSTSNLPVGTSAYNIVQLNGSAQLPAVDGNLLTNITQNNLSSVLDYGTSTSSGTSISNTQLKIAYGQQTISASSSVAITGLGFTSTSSYQVFATEQNTDTENENIAVVKNSASQITIYNKWPSGSSTISWFCIGT